MSSRAPDVLMKTSQVFPQYQKGWWEGLDLIGLCRSQSGAGFIPGGLGGWWQLIKENASPGLHLCFASDTKLLCHVRKPELWILQDLQFYRL